MDTNEFPEFSVMTFGGISKSEIALQLYIAYLSNPNVNPQKDKLDLIYIARKIHNLDFEGYEDDDELEEDDCE